MTAEGRSHTIASASSSLSLGHTVNTISPAVEENVQTLLLPYRANTTKNPDKMAAGPVDPLTEPRMYQQMLLQDGLCDLLENDKFVDCVLKIKDQEFPCHRLVLAASSPYFKAMFLSDLEESKKREIVLKDVEPGIMGMILKYIYTSTINLTEQNVQDIFMVANMYQIPSIFSVCISYLEQKMVLSNCLAIFRLGLLLECPKLASKARDYICDRFEFLVRDQDFQQLGSGELAAIITCDSLNVEKEETVFEALMKWVEYDPRERLRDLPDLLHCVRFRLMPPVYFKEKVEGHRLIRVDQDVKKELQLIKDAQKGILPKVKGSSGRKAGAAAGGDDEVEDEDEEESMLPGILNDNPRFGMFQTNLILMISNTGSYAYDPVENECFLASSSTEIPKNHCSLVTKENQIFVAGGLIYNEQNTDDPFSSYFLQVTSQETYYSYAYCSYMYLDDLTTLLNGLQWSIMVCITTAYSMPNIILNPTMIHLLVIRDTTKTDVRTT